MARLRPAAAPAPASTGMPRRLADPCVEDFLGPDGEPDPDWASHLAHLPRAVADDEAPYVCTAYAHWSAEVAAWAKGTPDGTPLADLYAAALGQRFPRWRSRSFMHAVRHAEP